MGLLELFITASVPILNVIIVTGIGSFLATDYIGIFGDQSRKHLNNAVTPKLRVQVGVVLKRMEIIIMSYCRRLRSRLVMELEIEIYTMLDELTSSISTANLEHVRRLKSHLLALTHRVQKVRDEIEQLMDDDGDMAEMYLTQKRENGSISFHISVFKLSGSNRASRFAPISPTGSSIGQPERAFSSTVMSFSKHWSSWVRLTTKGMFFVS